MKSKQAESCCPPGRAKFLLEGMLLDGEVKGGFSKEAEDLDDVTGFSKEMHCSRTHWKRSGTS